MNETGSKTASCLSITEKRTTHRPGGCVGIFFQLFDWNRRLAKKKLFSRKLLPPARAKQVSNKFGGDEKMPKTKIHLIADENSGGFPSVKRYGKSSSSLDLEQKHEMHKPGLVARLMGLESMPSVQKDKPKKGSCDGREEGFVNDNGGSNNKEDLGLEKGNGKVESRPQKLQKTGQFERRAVTRFGAEALQIKGVLSRSRKHQQPRLASPLKSSRVSSGRNMSRTSRLIDAATKILEPGLQATNRAKCALTYSSSTHYAAKNEVLTEERMGAISPDLSKQCGYNTSVGKSLMGQTSCKNCGNLLDVVDSRTNVEEQSFGYSSSPSNVVNVSSPGLGKGKPRSPVLSVDKEKDEIFNEGDQPVSVAVGDDTGRPISNTPCPVRKIPSQEGQDQWHLISKQCKPQKEQPPFAFNQRTQTQNRMSLGRDKIPSRGKLTNLPSNRVSSAANTVSGAKDFVALNRNLSGRSRPRVPAKLDNSTFEVERKCGNQGDDYLAQLRTPVRKRRTVSVNAQAESTAFVNTTRGRQRNITTGKQVGPNADSLNQTPIKSRAASQGDGNRANGNKVGDVVSFTFNSPLRQNSEISTEIKEKLDNQNNFISKSASYRRKAMDESDGASSLRKQLPLTGDSLGALLEEKLKELTSQEEDELTTAGNPPKRSTAMILQELISALTTEQPISHDADVFNTDMHFQTKANAKGIPVGFGCDGNHHSPGSVLEASFSNDSCLSSSLDDSSVAGHRLHLDTLDYSEDHPQPTEPDADLLDSATSISKGSTGNQMVNDLVNQISRMLHGINHPGLGLTGTKLTHTKDVILNAELLFGNTSLHTSDGTKDFLVAPFLLDELEVLATAMWPKFNCLLGFDAAKDGNQLKGFLFDCLIEFFNTKYGRYCNSGFNAWTRLPLRTKAEMLIREVGEEVIRWTHLAGMTPDEIIECDMSHSLGKWTDFDIEAFETGTQISWDILQILVEEIVTDLYECPKSAQMVSHL